ncbi:MAG TPA: hypothetical protein VI423_10980 [Paenisporosarcina sp.]|nr:hypothetical protein [Paenisporosarcina sp.]
MSKNYVVMDTCNLFLKAKSDGATIMSTTLQLASISQSITDERLKGGIGNGTLAILSTDKELTVNTRDALWNMDYLAMSQGVKVNASGAATIRKTETVVVVGTTTLTATVVGTPTGTTATYIDKDGSQKSGTVSAKVVTLTGGTFTAGEFVTVFYDASVTGEMVVFDSKTFSEKYSLELQTIAYDVASNIVVKDIYIQFDEVKPEGNFEMSFEAGSAISPELSFMVLTPQSSSVMGRIISVNRV